MAKPEIAYWANPGREHVVLNSMGVDVSQARQAPDRVQAGEADLVIADCRTLKPAELAGDAINASIQTGRALLFISPDDNALNAIKNLVAVCPRTPNQAMLVRSQVNKAGIRQFSIDVYGYPGESKTESYQVKSKGAEGEKEPVPGNAPAGERKPIESGQGGVCPGLDKFRMAVELSMEPGYVSPTSGSMPAGLKYFTSTLTWNSPFTYASNNGSNGQGNLGQTWIVWGFLSDPGPSGTKTQWLSMEGSYQLSPGGLIHDNDEGRGLGNCYLIVNLQPAKMNSFKQAPVQGGSVSFNVLYQDPLGGTGTYEYSATANTTYNGWGYMSKTSGSNMGTEWYMTSPCDGSRFYDSLSDAFTFWGHVKNLTDFSKGTAAVDDVNTWNSPTLQSGHVLIQMNPAWQGIDLWATGCAPLFCRVDYGQFQQWGYQAPINLTVDFTPIGG